MAVRAGAEIAIEVRIGDVVTVNYMVTNESARETVGQASYNVSPPTVGAYFSKINCFCFTEQRLKPGEKREMPVVFFVDPALAKDAEQDDLDTITLSYTMYPVRQSEPPRVGARSRGAPGEAERAGWRAPQRRRWSRTETLKMADAHANRTTTITSSIRARGRSSAPSSAFLLAVGAITWMHHMFAAAPFIFGAGAIGVLYTMHRLVARRRARGDLQGLPHARGADLPPLRDDPVHRLGGDVLRRLVLGLFQHRAVSRRRHQQAASSSRDQRYSARRHVAAEGRSRPSIPGICRCSTR